MTHTRKTAEFVENAGYLLRFNQFVSEFRRDQAIVAITGVLQSGVLLLLPLLGRGLVDDALIARDLRRFIWVSLGGGLSAAALFLLRLAHSFFLMRLRARSGLLIRERVARAVERQSYATAAVSEDANPLYQLSFRVDFLCNLAVTWLERAATILFQLFMVVAGLVLLHWKLSIVLVLLVIVEIVSTFFLARRKRLLEIAAMDLNRRAFSYLGELLSRILLVKAVREEHFAFRQYRRSLVTQTRLQIKQWRIDTINGLLATSLSSLFFGVIVLMASYLVVRGEMSAGTMTAFVAYAGSLRATKSQLALFAWDLFVGASYAKQLQVTCPSVSPAVGEAVEAGEPAPVGDARACGTPGIQWQSKKQLREPSVVAVVSEGGRNVADVKRFQHTGIEVQDLSFGYENDRLLLDSVSFSIPEKAMTAIVGPSGCGKSTLLRLILGLQSPRKGGVQIGGIPVPCIQPHFFRQQVAVVLQQPLVWNDSVENNLKFGNPKATRDHISHISQITGVDSFVRELPMGYATPIGENGYRLSEGQKQRLMIARALLRAPQILILDEAMSSLEVKSEMALLEEIRKLPIESTLLVSHRISSVRASDYVCFFKATNQIVTGSLEELRQREPSFEVMFCALA